MYNIPEKIKMLLLKYIFYMFLFIILSGNNLGVSTNPTGFVSVLTIVIVIDFLSGLSGELK